MIKRNSLSKSPGTPNKMTTSKNSSGAGGVASVVASGIIRTPSKIPSARKPPPIIVSAKTMETRRVISAKKEPVIPSVNSTPTKVMTPKRGILRKRSRSNVEKRPKSGDKRNSLDNNNNNNANNNNNNNTNTNNNNTNNNNVNINSRIINNSLEKEFELKKSTFLNDKKRLNDLQNRMLEEHKILGKLQTKLYGNEQKPVETFKIFTFVANEQDKNIALLLQQQQQQQQLSPKIDGAAGDNSNLSTDADKFTNIITQLYEKFQLVHESGFKFCQQLLDLANKSITDIKEIDGIGDVDIGDYQNKTGKLFAEIEQNILQTEKQQDVELKTFFLQIKQIFSEIASNNNQQNNEQQTILENKVKELEQKLESSSKNISLLEIDIEMKQEEIEVKQQEIVKRQKENEKLENSFELLKNGFIGEEEKFSSTLKKYELINGELTENLNQTTAEKLKITNDFKNTVQLIEQMKIGQEKIFYLLQPIDEKNCSTNIALNTEILENHKLLYPWIENEINQLHENYNQLRADKLELQKTITGLQSENEILRMEIEKREKYLNNKISKLKTLQNDNELIQNEAKKLKEIEEKYCNDINVLNHQLSKVNYKLLQQEESINMQQRLLRVRSELISSLQDKEDTTATRIEHAETELRNKTIAFNELNQELCQKTEQLQNLFSTLGMKQLELNRQNHIIHMLQGYNEQNQSIRSDLEKKIVTLTSENERIKKRTEKYA